MTNLACIIAPGATFRGKFVSVYEISISKEMAYLKQTCDSASFSSPLESSQTEMEVWKKKPSIFVTWCFTSILGL